MTNQLEEIVEVIEARKNLCSVNNNIAKESRNVIVNKSNNIISNVTEDLKQKSSNSENQLILLRSHLLNIAQIENDLQNAKLASTMNDEENNSVLDTLNSLQTLFKQTITEYNKLSSRLADNADKTVIFKIWLDYLSHVRSFLHTPLPSDYNVLKEQLHLCKIHQNLITNQRNALMHKISIDTSMLKDVDEFKREHVVILNEIHERQHEIESRINGWEKYRRRQADLLEIIEDIERQKSILHLKQLYLKSINKVRAQIDEILVKVDDAENDIVGMKDNQMNLLNFIDDITASALRLEFTSTHQRLANIRASLETWIDFLKRIQNLNNSYEFHIKSIQENYQRQLSFLNNIKHDTTVDFGNSKEQLEILKEKRQQLNEIKANLENLNTIKDEMKDYVSAYDIKMIRQTIWILWQQYSDLNHEYSLIINRIEERICLQTEFVIRYENLMFWLNETEGRLMEASSQKYYSNKKPQDDDQ